MTESLRPNTHTGKSAIPDALVRLLAAGDKPRRYRLRDGSIIEIGGTQRPPRGATQIS